MIKLEPSQFHTIKALFAPLMSYQIFCTGVLDGLYQGQVFVDDVFNPQTGFVTKDGMWWFLAGKPDNQAFNAALHTALFDRTIVGEKGWGGMLVAYPDGWDNAIDDLFAPHIPIRTGRLHYTCRELRFDWQALVSPDVKVRFVDESLEADGVKNLEMVGTVLRLRRESSTPDQTALGFVAIADNAIVAYATLDCIVHRAGDIGIYTDGAFRRRGLALLLSAALIEYALSHGLDVVHWNCEAFNRGSIRIAEKLGLTLEHRHTMYNLILNPVIHEVNRAWAHFDAGRYPQAIELCQHHIGQSEAHAHAHFYYIVARCHHIQGSPEQTMRWLNLAAQAGWDSVGEAQSDFASLSEHPAWPELVTHIEANAQ